MSSSSNENIQIIRKPPIILCDSDKDDINAENIYSETLPTFGGKDKMFSKGASHSDHNLFSSSSKEGCIFRSAELLAKSSLLTKTSSNASENRTFNRESCFTNEVLFTAYCVGSVINPFAIFPGQSYCYHNPLLSLSSTLFNDQTSLLNKNSVGIGKKLHSSCTSKSYSVVPKCQDRVKKHSCQVCGKGFKDSFDLKRHRRTHTGVRPYGCIQCDKAFSQRCSLEKHEKKKHGKDAPNEHRRKTYVCEDCGHSTPDPRDHYKHLLTYHPNNPAINKIHDRRFFKFPVGSLST